MNWFDGYSRIFAVPECFHPTQKNEAFPLSQNEYMLIHVKWLYAIEDFARRMQITHEERLALRQEHAKPKNWVENR